MMKARQAAVISAKWLSNKIGDKSNNIKILDGSYHLAKTNRNPRAEYEQEHIPGASFFDIDGCAGENPLPHMLPSTSQFENYVGKTLGIDNNTHVIIYDTNETFGIFSAPRVWWTFRVFGHDNVSILDGGIPKWRSLGFPLTKESTSVTPKDFSATYRPHLVKNFEDIENNMKTQDCKVVDARSKGRFEGTEPEPRPGIPSGHFQGACNIPFESIMDPSTKTVLEASHLSKLFEDKKVDLNKPLAISCGTGMTACCITLAAYLCGKEDVSVYDGSWTEWVQKVKPDRILSGP